jgi:hypothetical protein
MSSNGLNVQAVNLTAIGVTEFKGVRDTTLKDYFPELFQGYDISVT